MFILENNYKLAYDLSTFEGRMWTSQDMSNASQLWVGGGGGGYCYWSMQIFGGNIL